MEELLSLFVFILHSTVELDGEDNCIGILIAPLRKLVYMHMKAFLGQISCTGMQTLCLRYKFPTTQATDPNTSLLLTPHTSGIGKDHRSADGHNSQLLEFHLHFIISSFLLHSCTVRVTSIALALLFTLPLTLMQRSVTHCACYVKHGGQLAIEQCILHYVMCAVQPTWVG